MADAEYIPPKVWTWEPGNGGPFAAINRPTSGAQSEKELPVGKHPIQLYSLGTPNGQKVTIMLEELLAAGHTGAEYDAWLINIGAGEQFGSGFVALNPNSKIPAMCDRSGPEPVRIFESGAMLLYLAEKFGAFLPADPAGRAECYSWLMWQMGSAPFIGGGFGHFYHYAPIKIEYAINRYAMEVKRLFDVADKRLAEVPYLAGEDYTIADMACYGWLGALHRGLAYGEARTFLSLDEYKHVGRWVEVLGQRPAVRRGRVVNRAMGGEEGTFLPERHDASDFDSLKPGSV
jgi:GST-like protein